MRVVGSATRDSLSNKSVVVAESRGRAQTRPWQTRHWSDLVSGKGEARASVRGGTGGTDGRHRKRCHRAPASAGQAGQGGRRESGGQWEAVPPRLVGVTGVFSLSFSGPGFPFSNVPSDSGHCHPIEPQAAGRIRILHVSMLGWCEEVHAPV